MVTLFFEIPIIIIEGLLLEVFHYLGQLPNLYTTAPSGPNPLEEMKLSVTFIFCTLSVRPGNPTKGTDFFTKLEVKAQKLNSCTK